MYADFNNHAGSDRMTPRARYYLLGTQLRSTRLSSFVYYSSGKRMCSIWKITIIKTGEEGLGINLILTLELPAAIVQV